MHGKDFELSLMKFGGFSSLHHQPHLRTHIQPEIVLLLREGTIDMYLEDLSGARQYWGKHSTQSLFGARITRQQALKI